MNRHSLPNAVGAYGIQPTGGGSQPRFYDFDDGVVRLVKWHPGPHGPKLSFNELVCSRLGQLADAPIFRGQPVYVPREVMPPDHLQLAQPGVHFGITRMEGTDFHAATDLPRISNRQQIAQACVFLAWLNVQDQHGHNQYTQRVVEPGATDRIFLLRLIDMGFAFGSASWSAGNLLASNTYQYRAPQYFADNVDTAAVSVAAANLASISDADILACFQDVPEEWGVPAADVTAAGQWALDVRSHVHAALGRAHPKLRPA